MRHNFLQEVVRITKRRVSSLKRRGKYQFTHISDVARYDFLSVFKKCQGIRIIAEAKKTSPSAGVLVENYDPVRLCKEYQEYGCDALSVLTEPHFFSGRITDLKKVKGNTSLPVLRKDFIIDEIQIYQSKYFGADAVLLICKIVEVGLLKKLFSLARRLKLDVLVEVFDEDDLEKALQLDCPIVGINNRNLETLQVDINNTFKLIPKIPKDRIVISESGIRTFKDILSLWQAGVRGFLIGESFLKSKNLLRKVRELQGKIL